MKIDNILKEFIKECSEKLNLVGIVQFGSSTYSKEAKDIDLVFFSKEKVFLTEDYLNLFGIIKSFERRFKEVVFDIGGGERKRKGSLAITIVPINSFGIDSIKRGNPSLDSFLYKNLAEDKNKRILYGKDLTNFKVKLSNSQIAETLGIEVNHTLRKCLDDDKSRRKATYYLFKTTLRLMLSNEGILKKEELLINFENKYQDITIPRESQRILSNKIRSKDFESVLKFAEDCLGYLII